MDNPINGKQDLTQQAKPSKPVTIHSPPRRSYPPYYPNPDYYPTDHSEQTMAPAELSSKSEDINIQVLSQAIENLKGETIEILNSYTHDSI